jgi:sugar phosphate isomerase/epimerase
MIARLAALGCLATLSACAGSPDAGPGRFEGAVGLQLYSLRNEFKRDGVEATLDRVKSWGIREVELAGTYDLPPDRFRALLDERGLVPVSGHFGYARYKQDPEGVARDAKALGLKYAGCAWIDHKAPFSEAACRDAIAVFNKAGEILAREGIRLFYHIHGYEFLPHGNGTLFDLFMAETRPEHVSVQLDTLWAFLPGQDIAALLRRHGPRWVSMHLKDLKKGVASGIHTGKTDVENDVTLGTGQMDWAAILRAAREAGVKHYFIEDESSRSTTQVPETKRFLESLRW